MSFIVHNDETMETFDCDVCKSQLQAEERARIKAELEAEGFIGTCGSFLDPIQCIELCSRKLSCLPYKWQQYWNEAKK